MNEKRAKRVSKLSVKRGRYGSAKLKCFTVLANEDFMSIRELSILSGVRYSSIPCARWIRYEYVERREAVIGGYEYRLLAKGRRWLKLAREYLPNYSLFMGQLQEHRAKLSDKGVEKLLAVTWQEFVRKTAY